MKKILLSLIMCLILNTGYSQDKKIGFDSLWSFSYPDTISLRTALDYSQFIASTYNERKDMIFVFNEDSGYVKTYVNDTLVESSYICEIIRKKKQDTYKTHVKYKGTIYEGYFTIFYTTKKKQKIEIITGGFSQPDITNGFMCFHPHYVK